MSPGNFVPLGANDPACQGQIACIPSITPGLGPVVQPSPVPVPLVQHNGTRASWQPAAAQANPNAAATVPVEAASTPLIAERNTLGLVLAAVLILASLGLWMTYGKWPRRQWRTLRERMRVRAERRRAARGGDAERDVCQPECRPFHVYTVERDADCKEWRVGDRAGNPVIVALSKPEGTYSGRGGFGRSRTDEADEALIGSYVKAELS